jgi:hypothetical protein
MAVKNELNLNKAQRRTMTFLSLACKISFRFVVLFLRSLISYYLRDMYKGRQKLLTGFEMK